MRSISGCQRCRGGGNWRRRERRHGVRVERGSSRHTDSQGNRVKIPGSLQVADGSGGRALKVTRQGHNRKGGNRDSEKQRPGRRQRVCAGYRSDWEPVEGLAEMYHVVWEAREAYNLGSRVLKRSGGALECDNIS